MNLILQNNDTYKFVETTGSHTTLPVANYLLRYSELSGFYLEKKESFTLPPKIYGDLSFTKRWKKSFETTNKNLGILLSGYKGTGKTITAEYFCQLMNSPVIFITAPFSGAEFESFITNPLLSGSIIFIDEYEKIYNPENNNEEALLSIMDGMYNTHLVFLLTVNNYYLVSDKLKNRLGRIRYGKFYSKLEEDIVNDIIDDLLINKAHKKSIIPIIDTVPRLSIDILVYLIFEMNLFNEPADICASHLNIIGEDVYYKISIIYKGKTYKCDPEFLSFPNSTFYLRVRERVNNEIYKDFPNEGICLSNYLIQKNSLGYTLKYSDDLTIIFEKSDDHIKLLF